MCQDTQRLPQRAFLRLGHPLQEREPAMGYAARLAALNGVDLRKLLGDMRIDALALGRGEEDAVESLAALRSLGREDRVRLLRATPWHAVGDKVPTVNGNPLLPGSVLATSTRVCPHCIAEDLERFDGPRTARPWQRLDWVLAHVRACRRHGTVLLDVRPDETLRAGHDFSRAVALQVLPVLVRLRDDAIPTTGTAMARWFNTRLSGRRNPRNWLDDGPMHSAVAFLEALGISALHGHGVGPSDLSTAAMAAAAEEGYRAASKGPNAIDALLDRIVKDNPLKRYGSVGHERTYGQVHVVLRKAMRDATFDRYRHVLREHAFSRLPISPRTAFLGVKPPHRFVHTLRSAAFAAARSDAGLRRLVGTLGFETRLTLPVGEFVRLVSSSKDHLTAKEVAARTGLSAEQVGRMEEAGLLPTLPEEVRAAGTKRRFLRSDADAFMERLFRRAVPGAFSFGSRMTVERVAPGLVVSVTEILRLVHDDRLEWIGREGEGNRYRNLLVDKDEVARVLQGRSSDDEVLEQDAIALLPGVRRENLWRLVRAGVLEWSPRYRPRDPCALRALTKASVEAFASSYVMPDEIAYAAGIPATTVKRQLDAAGIRTAMDRDQVKCSIYGRQAVAAARAFDGWPIVTT